MAKREDSDSIKKGKRSGLGLALFVLAILVLFILFIKNWDRIKTNLKTTGFFEETVGKTPEFIEKVEVVPSEEKNQVSPMEPVEIYITDQAEEDAKNQGSSKSGTQENIVSQNDLTSRQQKKAAKESENLEKEAQKIQQQKKEEAAKKQAEAVKTMDLKLYFIVLTSDGSISRKEVMRTMTKTDGPLVAAINALIEGPTAAEEKLGCRSFISNGTRLIGASVNNGVALLNFSSEFEFNQYGIEGTRGQLQQIVYTATSFPTVESVQFLIDGEKRQYLGQEGVWIGTPLNRNSF